MVGSGGSGFPRGSGISQEAADLRYARLAVANALAAKQTFQGEIEIDGALNHDGATVGLYGVAPVARGAAIADPGAPGAVYVQLEAAAVRDAVVALITRLEAIGLINV